MRPARFEASLSGVSEQCGWESSKGRIRHHCAEAQRPGPVPQDDCTESPESGGIPFTGLGEVWFNSFDAAVIAIRTSELSAVMPDASTFMDPHTVVASWADEHRIIEPS